MGWFVAGCVCTLLPRFLVNLSVGTEHLWSRLSGMDYHCGQLLARLQDFKTVSS